MNTSKVNRALLKKQRVINFFLDAATKIATESEIQSITIRNVAELAGYNSATLYNYFENLDQLIAFTAIRSITDYLKELPQLFGTFPENPAELYLKNWECFCRHSFEKPEIFSYVYASTPTIMNNVQSHFKDYMDVFPDTFEGMNQEIVDIYFATTYDQHNDEWIHPFIKRNMISEENAQELVQYGSYLYDGILHKALYLKEKSPEEYTADFMKYFLPFFNSMINK